MWMPVDCEEKRDSNRPSAISRQVGKRLACDPLRRRPLWRYNLSLCPYDSFLLLALHVFFLFLSSRSLRLPCCLKPQLLFPRLIPAAFALISLSNTLLQRT